MMAAPLVTSARSTNRTRTAVGSTLAYSAMPPRTPANLRSVRDRYSLRGSGEVMPQRCGPAGPGRFGERPESFPELLGQGWSMTHPTGEDGVSHLTASPKI